jgi:hypothetical protein
MKKVPDILTLEEIKKEDIPSVGGKGASLGEMFSIGLPVPKAFCVTAQAFRRFLGEAGIEEPVDLEQPLKTATRPLRVPVSMISPLGKTTSSPIT